MSSASRPAHEHPTEPLRQQRWDQGAIDFKIDLTISRPIRVVLFGGAYFEPSALEFVVRLNNHPDIDFVGGFCEGPGVGIAHRVANLWRRRKLLAVPILGLEALRYAGSFLKNPRAWVAFRRRAAQIRGKITMVPDLHDPKVLEQVRALRPDLGVIYGGPLIKPSLFQIPTDGTLGIHHGRVPDYRGKKTTFWALYNGEEHAGVTIQRVNARLDRGDVVKAGAVAIGRKGYRQVEREVEAIGVDLYVRAILDIRAGRATYLPQSQEKGSNRLYRQPTLADFMRYCVRRLAGQTGWIRVALGYRR